MSDLVERLRSHMGKADMGDVLRDCRKAAARVEALEFEVDHLRGVLRTIRYGIDSECSPLQQDK